MKTPFVLGRNKNYLVKIATLRNERQDVREKREINWFVTEIDIETRVLRSGTNISKKIKKCLFTVNRIYQDSLCRCFAFKTKIPTIPVITNNAEISSACVG